MEDRFKLNNNEFVIAVDDGGLNLGCTKCFFSTDKCEKDLQVNNRKLFNHDCIENNCYYIKEDNK